MKREKWLGVGLLAGTLLLGVLIGAGVIGVEVALGAAAVPFLTLYRPHEWERGA